MQIKSTFVVLSYNHYDFVVDSLRSIELQTESVCQLIIADDNSTDGTQNKIRSFVAETKIPSVVYIERKENLGIVKNLVDALSYVTGDYIFLQAGDDLSSSDRVVRTVAEMDKNSANAACTSYEIINANSKRVKCVKRKGFFKSPLPIVKNGSSPPPYGFAFKNSFLPRVLRINSALKNEDDYLGFDAILNGGLLVIADCLYSYRIHSSSISSWSRLEKSNRSYLNSFLADLDTRISNFESWLLLLKDAAVEGHISPLTHLQCIRIIEKKIEIKAFLANETCESVFARFKLCINSIGCLGVPDFLCVIFGKSGALLLRELRRIKVKL